VPAYVTYWQGRCSVLWPGPQLAHLLTSTTSAQQTNAALPSQPFPWPAAQAASHQGLSLKTSAEYQCQHAPTPGTAFMLQAVRSKQTYKVNKRERFHGMRCLLVFLAYMFQCRCKGACSSSTAPVGCHGPAPRGVAKSEVYTFKTQLVRCSTLTSHVRSLSALLHRLQGSCTECAAPLVPAWA
jgi:hypothetical protein